MSNFFKSCLICKNTNLFTLQGYEHAHLVKCSSCKLIFSIAIPSNIELITHYKFYGVNTVCSKITEMRYNELLDIFEPYRQTNNILDVGCGSGFFLELAKKRGWNVFGIEFSDSLVRICKEKNITMHSGILQNCTFSNESFDVITSFEVIEHVNHPDTDVSVIYKLLRKKGVAYVTTPNFNSLSRYLLKSKYNVIEYPEHLVYFTTKTLNFLFKKNTFKKLSVKTSGFSITRYFNSKNKKQFVSNINSDERLRILTEKQQYKFIKTFINLVLNIFKLGDTLKGYYIKK